MQLSPEQVVAICRSPELRPRLLRYRAEAHLITTDYDRLSPDERDALHDLALDELTNSGPLVESYAAEQDLGPYTVRIRGVLGAYFVEAPEYDREGVFATVADARRAVDFHFGEFIKSGPA